MALYKVASTSPPAAADLNQIIALLNGTSGPFAGGVTVANRVRAQISGATATSGLVGMSALSGAATGGPPTTGTWALGDVMVDPVLLCLWVCVTAGTPGTWYRVGSSSAAGGLLTQTTGQGFSTRTGRTGFDIVLFDATGGLGPLGMPGSSTSAAGIIMPYAGTYFFSACVPVGGTAGQDIGLMILKNGQPYTFGSQFYAQNAAVTCVSGIVTTAVNDVIQVGFYSEGTYSVALNGSSSVTFYGAFLGN